MGMQKLPVLGLFSATNVNVAGITGTDALSPFTIRTPFANQVTISRFKLTVATSAVILSGRCTVTCASHLMTQVGQQVTFSGATGPGLLLNNQTWTIDTITSSSVYSFPCNLADGTATGTVVQEPVFTLPQGFSYCIMNANGNVEFCPDNTYNSVTGYAVAGVPTAPNWSILLTGGSAVTGLVASDGFGARIRCMGTTASSYYTSIG